MDSCNSKGRASLVIGKQRQRDRLQKRRWAEEEAAAEVARWAEIKIYIIYLHILLIKNI